MADQRITTAAELDAMSPAERHEHFTEAETDMESLPPGFRARVDDMAERVLTREHRQAS
jgi:hypothetical protein